MEDIRAEDHGTVWLLHPQTEAGEAWVNENIGSENGYQPYWPTVVVEHRYVGDILAGMLDDGLSIVQGGQVYA